MLSVVFFFFFVLIFVLTIYKPLAGKAILLYLFEFHFKHPKYVDQ